MFAMLIVIGMIFVVGAAVFFLGASAWQKRTEAGGPPGRDGNLTASAPLLDEERVQLRDMLESPVNKFILSIMFMIGIVVCFWGQAQYKQSQDAKNWPTVQGKVISSEINKQHQRGRHGGRSTTYGARVRYAYSVNGVAYVSHRVSFLEYSSSDGGHARRIVERYPAEKDVTVHYNPAKPLDAVLEPGEVVGIFLFLGVGGLFVIVSLVMWLTALKLK